VGWLPFAQRVKTGHLDFDMRVSGQGTQSLNIGLLDEPAHADARDSFLAKWRKPCPSVAASLQEAGEELLTFYGFPASQHKSLRTTNAIERLQEEFRRRVKTQASLPSEKAALLVFFGLFASGQVKMRRIEGWFDLAAVAPLAA
jgi:transposase-like protein